eukprot:3933102-Rhodomonas_salina.1
MSSSILGWYSIQSPLHPHTRRPVPLSVTAHHTTPTSVPNARALGLSPYAFAGVGAYGRGIWKGPAVDQLEGVLVPALVVLCARAHTHRQYTRAHALSTPRAHTINP